MKTKIEIGQCYRSGDIVLEVVQVMRKQVRLKEVMHKRCITLDKDYVLQMERPFKNWEGDE